MTTPIRKYRDRVRAQIEAQKANESLKAQEQETINKMADKNSKFTLLLQSIENDCTRISGLPKGSARTDLKNELLKIYLPVCDAYIDSGDEYENRALTQVLVWLFDVGDIDKALEYAAVAIDQKQPMPERYKRDIKTYVADAVLEWVDQKLKANQPVEPYFSITMEDVIKWPVHDPIKLKYLRQAAKLAFADEDLDAALEFCNKAEAIDAAQAKVKTLKKDIEKAIAVRDEAATAEAAKKKDTEENEK